MQAPNTYLQVFFIGSRHFGSSVRKREVHAHGQLLPPDSIAYFCETCGEVWARIVVENRPFRVWSIPCERHPHFRSQPAGSLWLSWDRQHNDSLPPEIIKREFAIHLAHWDYWKGDII